MNCPISYQKATTMCGPISVDSNDYDNGMLCVSGGVVFTSMVIQRTLLAGLSRDM